MKILAAISILIPGLFGCATAPKLDETKIRSWNSSLKSEYPHEKAAIAHYHKDGFDLFYLAARHTNDMSSDTLRLVEELFRRFKFNAVLIEPIPNSSGESPKWIVDEAKKGKTGNFISGGESSLVAILSDEKKIPFFGAEPDHQNIYRALRAKGYTDEDVVGFYVVRQVPQWVRERKDKNRLFEHEAPSFISHSCKLFSSPTCPTLAEIKSWYRKNLGHELKWDVSNEEVAPVENGNILTQKISSDVGYVRDHFTLALIEKSLEKYRRVAVIYGAGHFVTLRKSFDAWFGPPDLVEDATSSSLHGDR